MINTMLWPRTYKTKYYLTFHGELVNHPKQLSAPNLYALKSSLQTVFPELNDIYIQYVPKLQLMVRYQEQTPLQDPGSGWRFQTAVWMIRQ